LGRGCRCAGLANLVRRRARAFLGEPAEPAAERAADVDDQQRRAVGARYGDRPDDHADARHGLSPDPTVRPRREGRREGDATLGGTGSTTVWDNRWSDRRAWLVVDTTLYSIDLVSGEVTSASV